MWEINVINMISRSSVDKILQSGKPLIFRVHLENAENSMQIK